MVRSILCAIDCYDGIEYTEDGEEQEYGIALNNCNEDDKCLSGKGSFVIADGSYVVSKLRACILDWQCDEIKQDSKEMYNKLYSIAISSYLPFDYPNADSEGKYLSEVACCSSSGCNNDEFISEELKLKEDDTKEDDPKEEGKNGSASFGIDIIMTFLSLLLAISV